MEETYRIRCIGGFRDGNVIPEYVPPGKELTVNKALWMRIKQSDPDAFEVMDVQRRIPKPTKAKAEEDAKVS